MKILCLPLKAGVTNLLLGEANMEPCGCGPIISYKVYLIGVVDSVLNKKSNSGGFALRTEEKKHETMCWTESSNPRKQWAVKKINLSETNFCVEMASLRLVRHQNVV